MEILGMTYKQKEKDGIALDCTFHDKEREDKIKVKEREDYFLLKKCFYI